MSCNMEQGNEWMRKQSGEGRHVINIAASSFYTISVPYLPKGRCPVLA